MPSRALLLPIVFGFVLVAGCRHPWKRPPAPACPPGGGTMIPPAGIPDGPPPIGAVPRGVAPDNGSELILPQSPPGRGRSEYPRIVPADPRGAILGDPNYVERPRVVDAEPPAVEEKRAAASEVAVGIAEFAQVKDTISAGQRPTIEGLDWLKAKGYKTVVYLRGPKDDDTTDRRQVERREMKFVSLQVTPETLTQQWVDDLNQLIGDSASRPMFFYATDPQVASAAWYLHFRTAEFLTHDEARVRAGRYGRIDENSELFQAAVKLLSGKP